MQILYTYLIEGPDDDGLLSILQHENYYTYKELITYWREFCIRYDLPNNWNDYFRDTQDKTISVVDKEERAAKDLGLNLGSTKIFSTWLVTYMGFVFAPNTQRFTLPYSI